MPVQRTPATTRHAPNPVEVRIESLDAAGDGVAVHRGERVSVPFTIPGEDVAVRLGASRSGGRQATLVTVRRASPHRVTPACGHFGPQSAARTEPCGGCTWQHIAYAEQLRLKTALVARLVREAVPDAPEVREMLPSTPIEEPWGFRQKVHFVFGGSGRAHDPVMGHYARGSRRVVGVRECPVHDPRGNAIAFAVRDTIAGPASATLAGVAVRIGRSSTEMMTTLVVEHDRDRTLRAATRRFLRINPGTAVHLNLHPNDDGYVFGPIMRRLTGSERLREEVAGTSFLVSPAAFFQTNVSAAEILVRLVLDAVPAASAVLDLYAGAGLFALPLAKRDARVVAVEENRAAVADGEASLRLNRLGRERCRFVACRVETFLASRRTELRHAPDAVVLDPPRSGCSRDVVVKVFGVLRPALAAYVSCDPESLARDLREIARHGYVMRSAQPVDMFPHTPHVETVVVLARAH